MTWNSVTAKIGPANIQITGGASGYITKFNLNTFWKKIIHFWIELFCSKKVKMSRMELQMFIQYTVHVCLISFHCVCVKREAPLCIVRHDNFTSTFLHFVCCSNQQHLLKTYKCLLMFHLYSLFAHCTAKIILHKLTRSSWKLICETNGTAEAPNSASRSHLQSVRAIVALTTKQPFVLHELSFSEK